MTDFIKLLFVQIVFTVPIIPDYLFTSEQQEVIVTNTQKSEAILPITSTPVSLDCSNYSKAGNTLTKSQKEDERIKLSFKGTIWDHEKGSQDYNFQLQSTIYSSENGSLDRKHVERHLIHQQRSRSYDKILVTIIPFKKHNLSDSYRLLKTDYKGLFKHENKIEIKNSLEKKQTKRMFTRNEFLTMNTSRPEAVPKEDNSIQTAVHEEKLQQKSEDYTVEKQATSNQDNSSTR